MKAFFDGISGVMNAHGEFEIKRLLSQQNDAEAAAQAEAMRQYAISKGMPARVVDSVARAIAERSNRAIRL